VHYLRSADNIVVLGADGSISQQGSFEIQQSQDDYVRSLLLRDATETNDGEEIEAVPEHAVLQASAKSPSTGELDLKRKTGDTKVYIYYFQSIGWIYSLIFLALAITYIFLGKLPGGLHAPNVSKTQCYSSPQRFGCASGQKPAPRRHLQCTSVSIFCSQSAPY
jgi:hypothetical protein